MPRRSSSVSVGRRRKSSTRSARWSAVSHYGRGTWLTGRSPAFVGYRAPLDSVPVAGSRCQLAILRFFFFVCGVGRWAWGWMFWAWAWRSPGQRLGAKAAEGVTCARAGDGELLSFDSSRSSGRRGFTGLGPRRRIGFEDGARRNFLDDVSSFSCRGERGGCLRADRVHRFQMGALVNARWGAQRRR